MIPFSQDCNALRRYPAIPCHDGVFMSTTAVTSRRRRTRPRELDTLEDLPNVGPAIAEDFRQIGVHRPEHLVGADPYRLYDDLCQVTGVRHDPCVLDTFISAVRYMEGAPRRPWWYYTAERKRRLASSR